METEENIKSSQSHDPDKSGSLPHYTKLPRLLKAQLSFLILSISINILIIFVLDVDPKLVVSYEIHISLYE